MIIQFECPHCGKVLKTPDDKAGVRANCPGCGDVVEVPIPTVAEIDAAYAAADGERPVITIGSAKGPPPLPGRTVTAPAFESPATKPCPHCRERIPSQATTCRACGHDLTSHAEPPPPVHAHISALQVVETSWNLFTKRSGEVIGTVVLAGFLVIGLGCAMVMGGVMLLANAADQNEGAVIVTIVGIIMLVLMMYMTFFGIYAGMMRLLLDIAQGRPWEAGRIWKGLRLGMRVILLKGLAGLATAFVAGIFLGPILAVMTLADINPEDPALFIPLQLVNWLVGFAAQTLYFVYSMPMVLYLIDHEAGVLESMQAGWRLTSGNFWSHVGVVVLSTLILAAGFIFCGLGSLITVPLSFLIHAVAYCAATRQLKQ